MSSVGIIHGGGRVVAYMCGITYRSIGRIPIYAALSGVYVCRVVRSMFAVHSLTDNPQAYGYQCSFRLRVFQGIESTKNEKCTSNGSSLSMEQRERIKTNKMDRGI